MFDNRLSTVLVPLTSREMKDLARLFLLWGVCADANGDEIGHSKEVRLVISLDGTENPTERSAIEDAFNRHKLSRVFKNLDVFYCEIPELDNIYVRPGQPVPSVIPRLGVKSGPNSQFFRSAEYCARTDNTFFLNEVDCFPIRSGWLGRLQKLVSNSETFYVLGAPYRGFGKIGPDILTHVNGNALYGVGVPGAQDFFFKLWADGLADYIKKDMHAAYDVYFSLYFQDLLDPAKWGAADVSKFREYSMLLTKIRYTDLIHNIAGTEDTSSGKAKFSVKEYFENNPVATLVHGRYLYFHALSSVATRRSLSLLLNEAEVAWEQGEREFSRGLTEIILALHGE